MSSDSLSYSGRPRKRRVWSKKGCLACKTRRVKCDEVHPICTACSRRREACVWSNDTNAFLTLPHVARAALKPSKIRQLSLPPLSDFHTKELELLHSWTSNTMFTFIPDLPVIRYGFQVTLPQFAFRHQFLLHAMFAVTSLHMHHLLPSSNYLMLAKRYCQQAMLGIFKATEDSVSPEAVVMAAPLLATYWLALPDWELTSQSPFPDVFHWVPAMRTTMRTIGRYHQDSLRGAFSFLPRKLYGAPSILTPFPDIFYRIYDPTLCPFDTEELKDPPTLAAYETALFSFIHYSWNVFMEPYIQTFVIFGFICSVPDEFFKLFLERRPRALILVAHYCTIIGQFDGVWWYSWERCRHDLQCILSLLDPEWLPCMEYPLNVMALKDQCFDDGSIAPFASESHPVAEVMNGRNSLDM
ncbi:hypothetical protein DL96DRAFT_1715162 [Flagelloscypha sp. PMI_526]|nr:hypothetical protein DL96DRAFT_1715162 [Flagelloscypha sp. PMI_526]